MQYVYALFSLAQWVTSYRPRMGGEPLWFHVLLLQVLCSWILRDNEVSLAWKKKLGYFVLVMKETLSFLYCVHIVIVRSLLLFSYPIVKRGIVSHFICCNRSSNCVIVMVNPPPFLILVKLLKERNVMIMKGKYCIDDLNFLSCI